MLFQSPFTCDCWTRNHQAYTPNGKSLATVLNDFKVEIRESSNGNLLSTLRCIDKIDQIGWSPNGRHIFTAMYERNAVHVFTPPTHPTHASARIDGGELGVEYVMWSPNSQNLLVFGKNGIRCDIWELRTCRLTGIPCIKNSRNGVGFSPNKKVFAYLSRRNGKDVLMLHATDDWRCLNCIELNTLDANDMKWSPDGVNVAIADCQLEHRVVVVNSETGTSSYFEAYEGQKGVCSLCWCINSHLLAAGSGNDAIHILFTPDWKLLAEFDHINLSRIENADHYEEETPGRMKPAKFPMKYFDGSLSGIKRVEWSRSGRYIVSASKTMKRSVFIWDVETLSLIHAFTFLTPVTDFQWSPTDDNLAVVIGTDKLLTWKPTGFRISHSQEAAIQMHMVEWRPDGESLAAYDKAAGACTLAYVLEDDE